MLPFIDDFADDTFLHENLNYYINFIHAEGIT